MDRQAFSWPSNNRKEKARRRQSGLNYDERESVGVVLEDNDNDETDIRMKVVNNDMNKEGESIKMVEKTISFIKYNTIQL